MDARNLADLYDLPLLDWAPIEETLAAGLTQAPGTGGPDRHTFWLATINPDGTPHLTGVGASWVDGAFYVVTGDTSRKGHNLTRERRCSLGVAAPGFDLTVDCEAHLVTDPAVVADIAARARAHGWPAEVDESGTALTAPFSAPSAGPPPWSVYRLTPRRAVGLKTVEPGGATRWDFPR